MFGKIVRAEKQPEQTRFAVRGVFESGHAKRHPEGCLFVQSSDPAVCPA